jgi:ubiquinone/menaquinone biosynthesis C-methylase UbiE
MSDPRHNTVSAGNEADAVDRSGRSGLSGPETQRTIYPDSNYDLVAKFYPALERCVFGFHLENARQAFYEAALQTERVLLVGEGNGRFLKSLLARKTGGSICVLEKSPVMIRLAKERIQHRGKTDLEFIEADVRSYTTKQPVDCIVTHFFLDQFSPPTQQVIIDRLNDLTTDDGTWINVDFTPPRTIAGHALMWLQYTFFRIVSRVEARRCFDESTVAAQNGWIVVESTNFLGGFVVARRYKKTPGAPGAHGSGDLENRRRRFWSFDF